MADLAPDTPDRSNDPGARSGLRRDLGYAVLGQAAVLAISVVRTFLIPFLLGPDLVTYAQWQTYLLYLGYVSVAFLGFNDGLYVRHARRSGDSVRDSMSSALAVYSSLLVGEAILLCALVVSLPMSGTDTVVWVAVLANVPLAGVYGALVYHLQLSGRIDRASLVVAAEKVVFLGLTCIAYLADELSFVTLLGADVVAKALVVGHVLLTERRTVLAHRPRWRLGLQEFRLNVGLGVRIMIGAYCALLLSGATRIAAQLFQSDVTFALFAFAFSVSGIVLLAGQAAAMVIYPRMARLAREDLAAVLPALNRVAEIVFPVILVLYFPLSALVDLGLPQYSASQTYLAFLMAVAGLQLVVSTINNSYYRLLRLESRMLTDNALTLLLFVPVCILLRDRLEWLLAAQLVMLTARILASQLLFRSHLGMSPSLVSLRLLAWTAAFLGVVATANWWAVTGFVVITALQALRVRRTLAPAVDLLTARG